MEGFVETATKPLRAIIWVAITWGLIALAVSLLANNFGWRKSTRAAAEAALIVGFALTLYFKVVG